MTEAAETVARLKVTLDDVEPAVSRFPSASAWTARISPCRRRSAGPTVICGRSAPATWPGVSRIRTGPKAAVAKLAKRWNRKPRKKQGR